MDRFFFLIHFTSYLATQNVTKGSHHKIPWISIRNVNCLLLSIHQSKIHLMSHYTVLPLIGDVKQFITQNKENTGKTI